MKKNNKKGFTLAELLIVVAIIAVLVAVAIPIFNTQLEKSREATDAANIRSAYAEVVTTYLETSESTTTITVQSQQKQASWQGDQPKVTYQTNATQSEYDIPACTAKDQTYTVGITVDDTTGAVSPNITVA